VVCVMESWLVAFSRKCISVSLSCCPDKHWRRPFDAASSNHGTVFGTCRTPGASAKGIGGCARRLGESGRLSFQALESELESELSQGRVILNMPRSDVDLTLRLKSSRTSPYLPLASLWNGKRARSIVCNPITIPSSTFDPPHVERGRSGRWRRMHDRSEILGCSQVCL
jgi:hypothetical protein